MPAPHTTNRGQAALSTAMLVVTPALAIFLLHRLGRQTWMRVDWSNPAGWLARVTLEDALVTALRHLALLGAYWLLLSTLAYLLARMAGIARFVETISAVMLPPLRRMADRAVAGTVAVSTITTPVIGWAIERPGGRPAGVEMQTVPSPEPVVPGYLPPGLFQDTTALTEATTATADPAQSTPGGTSIPEPAPRRRPVEQALQTPVVPGDHLWGLAATRLQAHLRRAPDDHEVAPYWMRVLDANRDRLRSGDPDLIYPGEVVVLPPIDDRNGRRSTRG